MARPTPRTHERLSALVLLLVAVVAAFYVPPAGADAVYRDAAGDSIRFDGRPCPPAIAVHARQGDRGYYTSGSMTLRGVTRAVCGAPVRAEGYRDVQVHVIEDGPRQFLVPYAEFSDEEPPGADPDKPNV